MGWRRKKNVCGYWDCEKHIPDDDFLCDGHYQKWVDGAIDRCPKCGRFKDIAYQLCQDCYFGRKVKPKKLPAVVPKPNRQYRIEYSDAWTDGYLMPDKRFIYILELDDGVLYVGRTRDIYSQLSELRKAKTSPDVGHKAKLQYLEIAANDGAAELRQSELKRLVQSNPGQIAVMSKEFQHNMRDFGLTED